MTWDLEICMDLMENREETAACMACKPQGPSQCRHRTCLCPACPLVTGSPKAMGAGCSKEPELPGVHVAQKGLQYPLGCR